VFIYILLSIALISGIAWIYMDHRERAEVQRKLCELRNAGSERRDERGTET
jgi:hypothetical protein